MPIVNVAGFFDDLTPVGVSQLGTVVFDNVEFPSGVWVDLNGVSQFYSGVKFDAVTLSVNRTKEIVVSKVAGRVGSIKEYITNNDYNISMSAIVTAAPFSVAEIAQIAAGQIPGVAAITGAIGLTEAKEPSLLLYRASQLEKAQDSVPIRSKFLQNIYDINNVVIESFSVDRVGPGTWALKFEMLSDFEIDLEDFG